MVSSTTPVGRFTRITAVVVALASSVAGCTNPVSPWRDAKSAQAPVTTPLPAAPAVEPPSIDFPTPGPAARATARRFAAVVLEYAARSEHSSAFLTRVAPLASDEVRTALRHSPRANLPWRVMRERGERVTLTVTGTSITRSGTHHDQRRLTVAVNGIATTRTDVAVLRSPVVLELHLARTTEGWRVVGFAGGPA